MGTIKLRKTIGDVEVYSFTADDLAFSGANRTVKLTGFPTLEYDTQYYLEVEGGLVDDAGNAFNLEQGELVFSTGAAPDPPDTTPPTLVSSVPATGSTGQSITPVFTITFSEDIALGGTLPAIWDENDNLIFTYSAGGISIVGATATLSGVSGLSYSTEYFLQIFANSFTDIAGNDAPTKYVIDIETEAAPDTTPPSVTSRTPSDDATGITTSTAISLTFDEAVQVGTGSIQLKLVSDDSTVYTYSGGDIAFTVGNTVVTFSGHSTLDYSTAYYMSIPEGALEDTAGNNFAGYTSSTDWNWTTEAAPAGEIESGVLHKVDWESPFITGAVSESDIETHGPYGFATKGYGNGYDNLNLNTIYQDPSGIGTGRWAQFKSPGGLDAHTFSKAIRAVNLFGEVTSALEIWCKFEFKFDDNWIAQTQGKPGLSWTNPSGTSPGTNPTNLFEVLLHWFSCNNSKSSGLWSSTNPTGTFAKGDMLIGVDVYAADSRITNSFSEPVFIVEEAGVDTTRKIFSKDTHYVIWFRAKLNTATSAPFDGCLEAWYSEDGGSTYTKGIDITDMNWRGSSTALFYQQGKVFFRGGNGFGDEVGGGADLNNSVTHSVQDTWIYVKEIRTQTANPLPAIFT